ncbi:CDP-alcohol phosphatidyltransferase family protein [Kribbella kalugense]|uniref:Phosphoglycerol transferase MdoB-like AlkP superfamily enzyme n=1 Tax=Kribbella kalugense TaxID=2512221 RepID=A0A4R7ZF81_9ACTN|nr:CDP-alcohol phosphatidyltransferase family protein [Kribbella kalugense]TDW15626.1 phosphoglycerol transferase MdoB-like AlkP superfamily enzyme [Kribbella kalugense]
MRLVQGRVRSRIPIGPLAGFAGLLVLLGVLAAVTDLDVAGWVTGVACGAGLAALVARAMAHHRRDGLGPADRVTLARAVLACGVAALTADSFGGPAPVAILVTLATIGLVLDGVDGKVARRTGTVSAFGARFDMEVDAFLIMVLSVYVARTTGWWVLAIGLARYLFVVAGWALPWLRGSLPPRYWAKVVAAIQGIALTVAVAGFLPDAVTTVVVLIALGLLAESFGRQIWGLWRQAGSPRGTRATVMSALAVLLVWAALVVPDHTGNLSPTTFLRIPLEGLVFVVLVCVLPSRLARILALIGGFLAGVLLILRLLDRGFYFAFDRAFHPVYDAAYVGSGLGLLGDSIGRVGALAVFIGVGVLCLALLTVLPLSAVRVTRLVASHRRPTIRIVAVLAAISIVPALTGAWPEPVRPLASTSAARLATQVGDDLRDQRGFVQALKQDPFRDTPGNDLLTGLKGKDVLLVFVESYGRTALDSPVVGSALEAGDQRLQQAGFSSRSGFLTSPTYGGISWLAHSTLQSGLWVNSQQRYDYLVTLDRLTLTDAFGRAGWRTVADVPSNDKDWSVATTYYHYDMVYDRRNVGYAGPSFSYASMPDQYTLAALQRLELEKPNRAPVMAEVDLVSSHTPWAPLPRLVDWSRVGDGSVFDPMPAEGDSPEDVWRQPDRVKAAYAQSIAYSLDALTSFVQQLHDRNLVLIVLGDHQPASIVSGNGASHDVPVSIIAADPAVTNLLATWGWQTGLRPAPAAPTWPMDTFRDRFLTTYSH